jgi:type VI secretion system protein ImpF
MAKDFQSAFLQPSLLDRLIAPVPGVQRRAITGRRLRECVLRDLSWLLNCTNLESYVDLDLHPNVAASTLNFGMPGLAGNLRGAQEITALAERIRRCIARFEPRLSAITVTPQPGPPAEGFTLEFRIDAELWGDPLPQHLRMRTQIDLGSGEVAVEDRGG